MGKDDIKKGIVRTPLDPDIIFTDDPLRILRAARFTAKYNWKLPMFMLRSIKKNAHQLSNISRERIHDETNKMLLTDYPYKAFRLLQILGLMKYVFPSLQNSDLSHMKDLAKLKKNLALRLIGALKPINPDTVRTEMLSLRYSTDVIRAVVTSLIYMPKFLLKADKLTDDDLRIYGMDIPAYVTYLFAYASVYSPNFDVYDTEERYDAILEQMKENPIPVTGQDLIDMGMKPSPKFKELLNLVKRMYIQNPKLAKDEYLKAIQRAL
jgi:tRNA nucleotidyltransferase/poly(A) polymerase